MAYISNAISEWLSREVGKRLLSLPDLSRLSSLFGVRRPAHSPQEDGVIVVVGLLSYKLIILNGLRQRVLKLILSSCVEIRWKRGGGATRKNDIGSLHVHELTDIGHTCIGFCRISLGNTIAVPGNSSILVREVSHYCNNIHFLGPPSISSVTLTFARLCRSWRSQYLTTSTNTPSSPPSIMVSKTVARL